MPLFGYVTQVHVNIDIVIAYIEKKASNVSTYILQLKANYMLYGTFTAFIKVMTAYNDQDKSSDLECLTLPFTLLLSHYYSIHGICGAPGVQL